MLLFICFASACGQQAAGDAVDLATEGHARFPIILSTAASDELKQTAATLAEQLEKISGAKFTIETGEGKTGLVLGTPEQFPALGLPSFGEKSDFMTQEDYLIRSHTQGVYLIGTTDLAVQHAIWDLLYHLGYRQFFPGPTWEIIPKLSKVTVSLDLKEHPDFRGRSIWYGYGFWTYNNGPYKQWVARNRLAKSPAVRTGHAYNDILRRNSAEFEKHPEYLGLIQGERKSSKFCISNPDLRKLVVEDALRQMEAGPNAQSISMEPSDGGDWCECDKCAAMGSITNRAVTLSNEVAEALTKRYGDKYVGMYAYHQHSPPPTIKVHPCVVVSVATSYIKGGFTVDQLLEGWHKQGATLGIREYYSVPAWDRDLPGSARGAQLDYIQTTIPAFHARGARIFNAESGDNWGPNGLGYYFASRVLWNIKEAQRRDAIVDDFLDKAFGQAREPMRKFYQTINGGGRSLLSDDLIGWMYRLLDEARRASSDPAVQNRLNDLVLYTRYVEIYFDYSSSAGQIRQKHFEELIRHAYRMRKTMMVHAQALYRDLTKRDKSVSIPAEAQWDVPEGKNSWKSSEPFTREELDKLLAGGISSRKALDFEPVSFSGDLVPAGKLRLAKVKEGSFGIYLRGANSFLMWVDRPTTLKFTVKGGTVYSDLGDVNFALFPAAEPEGKDVSQARVPPDKQEHPVELATTFTGLHRLQMGDRSGGTNIIFPADFGPLSVMSSPAAPFKFQARMSLYFYVPKGTKTVGGFAEGVGSLLNGAGKQVLEFTAKPDYFNVPVEPGQDGTLWKFENSSGTRYLMTVPPYLARNGQELLLPKEVVNKDAR